jgi:hypothetical protein
MGLTARGSSELSNVGDSFASRRPSTENYDSCTAKLCSKFGLDRDSNASQQFVHKTSGQRELR